MPASAISYLRRHYWGMLATFIALGGSAYAATELPPSSVGTNQIQRGAVTLGKISAGAQFALRTGVERSGASDAFFSVGKPLKVPPGDYLASGGCSAIQRPASGQSINPPLAFGEARAILTTTNAALLEPFNGTQTSAAVPNEGERDVSGEYGTASLSTSAGFHLPKGGKIYLYCAQFEAHGFGGSEEPVTVGPTYLIAVKVGKLHIQ